MYTYACGVRVTNIYGYDSNGYLSHLVSWGQKYLTSIYT